MSLKVMVTASSTPAGRSMLRELSSEGVSLISCDCDTGACANGSACHFSVHRSDDPEFVGDLVTLCLQHDVDVLVPMRASDLDAISGARQLFECIGARVWPSPVPPQATHSGARSIIELCQRVRIGTAMSRWLGRLTCPANDNDGRA
jgi:hypothetical protein